MITVILRAKASSTRISAHSADPAFPSRSRPPTMSPLSARAAIMMEVRHNEFFHKGAAEKTLNRLLITRGANRAMLDVRPLSTTSPDTHPGLQHAQSEKPRVPLHVLSTGGYPLVRFIGHLDTDLNDRCFTPWIERLALWTNQGKTPYPMVHTPDDRGAPGWPSSV